MAIWICDEHVLPFPRPTVLQITPGNISGQSIYILLEVTSGEGSVQVVCKYEHHFLEGIQASSDLDMHGIPGPGPLDFKQMSF